jgi:hypothetical protein
VEEGGEGGGRKQEGAERKKEGGEIMGGWREK